VREVYRAVKAVSPVIATVILVAVAIALSIAIALWITGMTGAFTGVEKLEVVNAYAETKTTNNKVYWQVTVKIKNTGTKAVTIDGIFINNKAGTISSVSYTIIGTSPPGSGSFTLNPGEEAILTFNLNSKDTNQDSPSSDKFSSGQTIGIVIHTASGGQYPTTVTLP